MRGIGERPCEDYRRTAGCDRGIFFQTENREAPSREANFICPARRHAKRSLGRFALEAPLQKILGKLIERYDAGAYDGNLVRTIVLAFGADEFRGAAAAGALARRVISGRST